MSRKQDERRSCSVAMVVWEPVGKEMSQWSLLEDTIFLAVHILMQFNVSYRHHYTPPPKMCEIAPHPRPHLEVSIFYILIVQDGG